MAVFFPLPTPADTARDLLVAAAWLRAAGYPADHLVGWAIELLGVPIIPRSATDGERQNRQ